jgi:hypothetical protein
VPKPRLLPIPDVPNRRHPAYDAAFEAYLVTGGVVARSHKLLEEMWDPNLYGADVPNEQTLRKWVREDDWKPICRAYALENKPRIRESLNADILLRMGDALEVVTDIMHDNEPDHAKINSVKLGAANRILTLGAAGVQETRYGDLPDHNQDAREAVARVRQMTPEEILEAETEELEAEREQA